MKENESKNSKTTRVRAEKRNSRDEFFLFLSYAREDKKHVDKIYGQLLEAGLNPWMDKPPKPYQLCGLAPGSDWESVIRSKLQTASLVLLFLSRASISKEGFVQKEFRLSLKTMGEKPPGQLYLIPILLEPCSVPDYGVDLIKLNNLQWFLLYEQGIQPLLDFLINLAKPDQRPSDPQVIMLQNRLALQEVKLDAVVSLFKKSVRSTYKFIFDTHQDEDV